MCADLSKLKPTILLTGFGPFPGIADNVSARYVPALARRARTAFPEQPIVSAVLATEWRRAPDRVTALIVKHRPHLALHFGVASGSTSLRIEQQAHNTCRAAPDAAGLPPLSPVLFENGKAHQPVTIPVAAVYQKLAATGVPVSISDDAGGYLCNAVLYHSLSCSLTAGRPKQVGFIHLPDMLETPPLTFPVALNAGLAIIEACLSHAAP
jgi:pyroglutamyl-peptidase